MSVEIFLDVDTVQGEAQAKDFTNKIDVFSFSFGASNPSTVGHGTGSGAGKVDISTISLQKTVDKATPKLFLACCQGKHFTKAKLTVREAGGDAPVDYLVVDFTQVFVDSISWGGAAGGGKPSESLSFSFATVKIAYTEQAATGGGGTAIPAGWDIQKNTKL
jgi:type VI secretion system secreted protein Hcp